MGKSGGNDRDRGGGTNRRGWWRLGNLKDPQVGAPETVERNEKIVAEGFWPKLRRLMGKLPFAEDLVAAYFCAMDPKTPWQVRAILLAALAYFVVPLDFIPDFLAGLGFVDDAGVLMTAVKMVADNITEEHRAKAREVLAQEDIVDPDDPQRS